MTESYKYYTIQQCIWKPCRDHSYQRPMCTWAILVILSATLDLVSRWPQTLFQHQERLHRPKINGNRGIAQVSVLHWSRLRTSTNPRWPPDAILDYPIAYPENDRESLVLDSKYLQATFLKKNQLSTIFFHFKVMLLDYVARLNFID